MRNGQFRVVREGLGLSRTDIAQMTQVSTQAVKNWEQIRNFVPPGVGHDLATLEAWTERVVQAVIQAAREHEAPLLLAYRTDEEMPPGPARDLGAAWWRQVIFRAHLALPDAEIVYPQETHDLGSLEERARRTIGAHNITL